jgi:hypothetical protein
MGEIAVRSNCEEKPAGIFNNIITSPHPFALPRLIARFYMDSCSKEDFKKSLRLINPGSKDYLMYYAKKALIDNDPQLAHKYWEDYKQDLPPNIWPAQLANKALSLLEK